MTLTKRFGILGGGIAGLSLSYFLGAQSEVLEQSGKTGGLCQSYTKDGFTYDMGGHVIFSKDKEVVELELALLKDNVTEHFRRNSIWFKNRHVKYPFENGLSALDKEDIFDCLYNFVYNPAREQHNFEDWIYNTFGSGLAEKYLIPYNRKIWKTDLKEMATDWVERIPKPPVEDIFKSALGITTEGYLHQLYFHYPKEGGFESLPAAFQTASQGAVKTDFRVKSLRKEKHAWVASNGQEEVEYERLICTIPLFELFAALPNVPPNVKRAVDSLQYNSLIVVMVGISGNELRERFGVYIPAGDLLFHRLCFYGYFGDHYAPAGTSSIVAEITAREGDATWLLSDEQIVARTIDGLIKEGFINRKQILTTDIQRTRYAYVIYDLHRARNLDLIKNYCRELGIELCGRFAQFEYVNSDAVVRSAKSLADRLLGAEAQRT